MGERENETLLESELNAYFTLLSGIYSQFEDIIFTLPVQHDLLLEDLDELKSLIHNFSHFSTTEVSIRTYKYNLNKINDRCNTIYLSLNGVLDDSTEDILALERIGDSLNKLFEKARAVIQMFSEHLIDNINEDVFETDHIKNTAYLRQLPERFKEFENNTLAFDSRITDIEESLEGVEASIKEKYKRVDQFHDETIKELEEKRKEIDDLLGTISKDSMSKGYDQSASLEKKVADLLRAGSLVCMFVIVITAWFSFYETTAGDFSWERSLFRLIFIVLLSIPAAYMARESSKHRQQQYNHHQMSLDIRAVGPYLESLPDEDKHRIKAEIAQRLFASKESSQQFGDPYPINTHEIIMAVLKKLEFKQQENKSEGK